MDVLLGGVIIVCLFVAAVASLAVGFGALMWLRWRVSLIPYFRMSQNMRTWYKREQQKDWSTRCGQRVSIGLAFLLVQLPFFFFVPQRNWPVRTVTLCLAIWIFIRGAWGRWLGGEGRKRQRVEDTATNAHAAFANVTPTSGAHAREMLMDIFTAERVVRYGAYAILASIFIAALARDGGASSVLDSLVLR